MGKLIKPTVGTPDGIPVIFANSVVAELGEKLNGKTLFEVDKNDLVGEITNVTLGKFSDKGADGNPVKRLVLHTKSRKLVFGLSRNFDELLLETSLGDCRFYMNNKLLPGDAPGEGRGPAILTFGKPGGSLLEEETSLVGVEAKAGA